MICDAMILAGALLMVPRGRAPIDLATTGDTLREAFASTAAAPVPRDMRAMTTRIAGPLRVVDGKRGQT